MSLWQKTGTVHIETYRRKTIWERFKAFLDGLAKVCAVFLVLIFILAAIG